MKFVKKDLKKLNTMAKKITTPKPKEKDKSEMLIQAQGEKIIVRVKSGDLVVVGELQNLAPESKVSFVVNPHDFESLLGGKDKEVEIEANEEFVTKVGTGDRVAIKPFKRTVHYNYDNLSPFKNFNRFHSIFQIADEALFESEKESTRYLQMKGNGALIATPKRIHLFKLEEEFNFNVTHFEKATVSHFIKHLEEGEELLHGGDDEEFVIRNGNVLFIWKVRDKANFPQLQKMSHGTLKATFEIDTRKIVEAIDEYKSHFKKYDAKDMKEAKKELGIKDFTRISIQKVGNELILDVPQPGYFTQKIPLEKSEGDFERILFEVDKIRGYFSVYDGIVTVKHQQFVNSYGQPEEFMWLVYIPEKISMITGFTEPDGSDEWAEAYGEGGWMKSTLPFGNINEEDEEGNEEWDEWLED